jgi:hypothetical protein
LITIENSDDRQEILDRLQSIRDKGNEALRLLESKPLSPEAITEIQNLTHSIKQELQAEYTQMLPERVQKTSTIAKRASTPRRLMEGYGYWSAQDRGVPDRNPLEAVVYKAGLYLS